jgi:hypothetical protein
MSSSVMLDSTVNHPVDFLSFPEYNISQVDYPDHSTSEPSSSTNVRSQITQESTGALSRYGSR